MMFAGIGVVFLILPLLFLPWTIDALEIHKQLILIFGSGVSVAGLMLRWMHSTEIHIQWHPLLAVYAAFVLMLAISSFFSLHGYTSWMGQGKQEYLSFATHFSLLNLWFVFLQLKKKVLHFPLLLLFAGAALMALIGLLRFIFPNLLSTWFVGTGMQFVAYMLTLGIAGGFFFAILGHIRGSFPAYAAYSMRVLGLFLFISSMIFALSIDGDGSRWIWAGIIASIGIPMIFITNRQDLMKNVNVYIPLIIGFVLACIFSSCRARWQIFFRQMLFRHFQARGILDGVAWTVVAY